MLIWILIVVASVVILALTSIMIIMSKYKKELHAQEWYEDFQYEFKGVECGHEKNIKLADTNWKFAFTLKKEKRFTVNAGPIANTIHQVHYRFFCDECGKKRWFEQTNSVRDHKGLFTLRLKYLAIGFVTLMLLFVGSMSIIFGVIVD
ncbi:hypothetical protein H9649_16975 [Sporosarcina sp. Sa2YVA2]|uniref:DUF3592 domain-containing protein n=1 Tax=Sporosarcina quadrami TaxID=2762234 RepID=A0ABR8UE19_9BACL|nr:hypothetical protein [Sporosarcina quadrami]MBD7986266.1 hypothetical protein [Sporosarcina quadrami]